MAENTNIVLTVEAWADIVIKEWLQMVNALGIFETGNLAESFNKNVIMQAEGDKAKIIFVFAWYGKMVDYGVGRYVNLKTRDALINAGATKRRPKPWFSDLFYKQLASLRHILEEKYALKAQLYIIRNLEDNADYGFKELK